MQTWNPTTMVSTFNLKDSTYLSKFSRPKVTQVGSTELLVIFVDDSSQLWSFPSSEIESEKIYATQIELNSSPYAVRQFATGKRHCAVLVDFVNVDQQASASNQSVTVCEKCKEDACLRLSALMESANEQFQVNTKLFN